MHGTDLRIKSRRRPQTRVSVPSLFRLTLINTIKRCKPMHSEIAAQRHDYRSRDEHQKFELYYDC
jgi:hypothetical protein